MTGSTHKGAHVGWDYTTLLPKQQCNFEVAYGLGQENLRVSIHPH